MDASWKCNTCDRWDSTKEDSCPGDRLTVVFHGIQHAALNNHEVTITIHKED